MNKEATIWILEDDLGITYLYKQMFDARYTTRYFSNLKDFDIAVKEKNCPDLLVADLLLTDGTFIDYLSSCEEDVFLKIPFLVVSSIDDLSSLRKCFDDGALDYITKPFKRNELEIKIENCLNKKDENKNYHLEDLSSVTIEGRKVDKLTKKEMQLLLFFLDSPDMIASRDVVLKEAWGSTTVNPKTVDVHLYNLRRKLLPYNIFIKPARRGSWQLLIT